MSSFVYGIYIGVLYGCAALAISLSYALDRRFYFSQVAVIPLAGYLWITSIDVFHVPVWAGLAIALISAILFSACSELCFFRAIRLRFAPVVALVASLGLYMVAQNLVSIMWGDSGRLLPIDIAGGTFYYGLTASQWIGTLMLVVLACTCISMIYWTRAGLAHRAYSCNPHLARTRGLPISALFTVSFGASGLLLASAGLLVAGESGIVPTSGVPLFVWGYLVLAIAGNKPGGAVLAYGSMAGLANVWSGQLVGDAWREPAVLALAVFALAAKHRRELPALT